MDGFPKNILLFFWLLVCGTLYAQNITRDQVFVDSAFTYDHWTVEDGLPVNSINQIIQSREGYLWFGTNDGLVRFDGIRFKVYKSAGYEGLSSNRIVNLVEASDSSIWLKTDRAELIRFKNETFHHFTEKDGLNGTRVHTMHIDEKGTLWIGASKGISVYKNKTFIPYYPDVITEQVAKIYVNPKGILWYKDDESLQLFRFDGSSKSVLVTTTDDTDPSPFLTLKDGSTIFATFGHIYKYEDGTIRETIPNLPVDFQVIDFYETPKGAVLVASLERGIFKLSGENWTNINAEHKGRKRGSFFSEKSNLWAAGNQAIFLNNRLVFSSNNQIAHYLYDREGSFWFGTTSAGLFRLKPNIFTVFSEPEGVPNRNIYPVYEAHDSSIWFGTHGDGPVRLRNDQLFFSFPFLPDPQNQYVRSIVQRSNGDLLISLLGDGIYKFDPQKEVFEIWETPVSRSELARVLTVETLYEDNQNQLWAGSNHGLYVMNDSSWEHIPDEFSNSDYTVRYITEAPDSSLWMATNGGGILHHNGGKFTAYTHGNGLSSNLVRSLYADTVANDNNEGYTLWIGSENKGIDRLTVGEEGPDFSSLINFNQKNGLYDHAVHQILVDKYDRFWMSGNKGIYWVTKNQFEEYVRGEINEIQSTAYTEQDGLRNREANGGVQPAGIKSKDGQIWFPTQDGLVKVNPEEIIRNELAPPVIIEEVKSKETLISKKGMQVVLQPVQRDFEIAYTGLSFMVPKKVRFRYRLKGFNDKWIEAGTRRTAFYTNVPTGIYTFEVLAANNEGVWSPEPVALSVRVLPYFYETRLFYLFLFMILTSVMVIAVRFRTRRLKIRERELEQSVQQRTAELEQEKQKTEVQAQELLKLDKAKSQFFTNITHEFRTPLTLITAPLQKLLDNYQNISTEESHFEMERMLRNSFRLQRLIDQILDVSKLEAGELRLNIRQTDMVTFIQNLMELFKPLVDEQEQMLTYATNKEECLLYLDVDALEKIMANLISNAIKFTPPGGKIRVDLNETEAEVIIKVADSGIGIPKEKTAHIFDRFFQVDDSATRIAEGSGVGLSLVKNLVELHKGTIGVESEVGKGTTFTIHFRKGKAHFEDIQITADTEKSRTPFINASSYSPYLHEAAETETESEEDKPTVLIVEDNPDMRSFIRSVLQENFAVISAPNGEEALEIAASRLPDLIVADIMMPRMDGMELNQRLKTNTMLQSIPVIFLTAKTSQGSKLKGFEEDADDYLTKPFDPKLLVSRVDNLIRNRKKLQEHYIGKKSREDIVEVEDPFLKAVYQILEEHFANPEFGISELSELLHLDRTRLYRKLKELTSKSPQQIVSDFRMKKAAMMITQREGNISEIAYASGFNSLAYFSKVFKRYYKVSPSEFGE